MSSSDPLTVEPGSNERWKFFRDVLVFQLKMLLDNIRDFTLMPVALVAALIDLIFKGKRHGSLFYQVLRWGARSEEVITSIVQSKRTKDLGLVPTTPLTRDRATRGRAGSGM